MWTIDEKYRFILSTGRLIHENVSSDKCPFCASVEVEANTPRTVYACGSSDYDQRPNTFKQSEICKQSLILSTGRPVKKVQIDDEVEALARELYINGGMEVTPKGAFKMAEDFINHRNERRGKK